MSMLTKSQSAHSTVYNSARKQMELIIKPLPHCILLIYGYIRIYLENNHTDIIVPKSIIKFILKGLNALKSSNELHPFFKTPIEKLPGFKSGIISLMKVIEAVNIDENKNKNDNQIVSFDESQQKRNKLISTIAKILTKLCDANRNFSVGNNEINFPFTTVDASISIDDYLERFNKYSRCSNEVFVMALIYIDRIIKKCAMVNKFTIHKALLIAIMTASKFQDDIYYDNKTYAMLGGVSLRELNQIETHFLFTLSFDLCIQHDEYQRYCDSIANFLHKN